MMLDDVPVPLPYFAEQSMIELLESFFTSHALGVDDGPPPAAFLESREKLLWLLEAAVAEHDRPAVGARLPAADAADAARIDWAPAPTLPRVPMYALPRRRPLAAVLAVTVDGAPDLLVALDGGTPPRDVAHAFLLRHSHHLGDLGDVNNGASERVSDDVRRNATLEGATAFELLARQVGFCTC